MTAVAPLADALVQWFRDEGRDYPWRRTTDPWSILVSEVMLQQTTIPTVLGRYEAWMQQFPTPAVLAAADEETALRSWEGLGYYRRVRSLRATAIALVERHSGVFPETEDEIRSLPGIGAYTAGALLSFAFNRPAPLVDANVSRIFARLENDRTPIDSADGRKKHWEMAARLVHPTEPRLYNSALMELGQRLCRNGMPDCLLCPIRAWCRAEQPEELPVKQQKIAVTSIEHNDIFHLTPQGLLMERQSSGQRHEGMYRLPQRSRHDVSQLSLICHQKYSVTRYKVTRHLYRAAENEEAREGECYISLNDLTDIPMASPDRKLISKLL